MKRVLLLLTGIFFYTLSTATAQFWERTDGPYGIHAWISAQGDEGTLYVDGKAGFFRSTDVGLTWHEITIPDVYGSASDIRKIIPLVHDSVLIAAEDPEGILVSSDNGYTWSDNTLIDGFIPDFTLGGWCYNNSSGSLYFQSGCRSTDFGATFDVISLFPDQDYHTAIVANDSTILFGAWGITSYNEISDTCMWEGHLSNRFITGFTKGINGRIWAYGHNNSIVSDTIVVAYTDDGGTSWNITFDDTLHEFTAMTVTSEGDMYATSYDKIFRSTNNGYSWDVINVLVLADYKNIIALKTGGLIATSLKRGVHYSPDGDDWTITRNHGLYGMFVGAILQARHGVMIISTANGLYRTTDKGMSFQHIDEVEVGYFIVNHIAMNSRGTMFLTSPHSGYYRSHDNGHSWDWLPNNFIKPDEIVYDSHDLLFLVQNGFVATSSDDGTTFQPHGSITGMDKQLLPLSNGGVLAASSTGISAFSYQDSVFHSINNSVVSHRIVLMENDQLLVASDSGAYYLSTDMGYTWQPQGVFEEGRRRGDAQDMIYVPGTGVYVVYYGAIGFSSNEGKTWTDITNGIDAFYINNLSLGADGRLYVSTYRGLFRSREVVVSTPVVSQPGTFTLSPAYPNPFSGSTTISYSLSTQQYISLDIYNILGEKVQTLLSGTREPGTHTARLDASALPVGTYRLVLRSGEGTQTQMVVVR